MIENSACHQESTLSQLQIICVENDENDRKIFETVLKRIIPTTKINFFKDGEDFTHFLFRQGVYKNRPSYKGYYIAFLDLQMPKMNGLDVLKKIRPLSNNQKLPIIMLSTSSREQDIAASKRLGALDYIVKPFSYKEMISIFSDILENYLEIGAIQEIEL